MKYLRTQWQLTKLLLGYTVVGPRNPRGDHYCSDNLNILSHILLCDSRRDYRSSDCYCIMAFGGLFEQITSTAPKASVE